MSIESMKKVRGEMNAVLHLLEGAVGRLDDVVTEAGLSAHGQLTLGLGGLGGEVNAVDGGVAAVDPVGAKTDDEAPVGVMELERSIVDLRSEIGGLKGEQDVLVHDCDTLKAEARKDRATITRLREELAKEKRLCTDMVEETAKALAAKQGLETTISRALDQLVKPGDAQGILMGAIHILKGGAEAGGENLYAGQCEHGVPIGQGCEACGRVIGGQGECRQDAGGPSEDETKTKR